MTWSLTAATPGSGTTSGERRRSVPTGIRYVDCGTSGGVWGLERGYCLMIGGPDDAVAAPRPTLPRPGPGRRRGAPNAGAERSTATAEQGISTAVRAAAGHFVKMVHNGIEYGVMAAYAEGLNILKHADAGLEERGVDAETTTVPRARAVPVPSSTWRLSPRCGAAAASSPRGCSTSPRRRSCEPRAGGFRGPRLRLGRGPLDEHRRNRRRRAGAGAHDRAVLALHIARRGGLRRTRCCRRCARLRRAPGAVAEGAGAEGRGDAAMRAD